jgi:hypothetical protein
LHIAFGVLLLAALPSFPAVRHAVVCPQGILLPHAAASFSASCCCLLHAAIRTETILLPLLTPHSFHPTLRSHKDLAKDAAPHFRKAKKFYDTLASEMVSHGHICDIFSCALDNVSEG